MTTSWEFTKVFFSSAAEDSWHFSWVWDALFYLDVSKNSGTPKASISIGFSIINHPFWGTPDTGGPEWTIGIHGVVDWTSCILRLQVEQQIHVIIIYIYIYVIYI